MNEIFTNLEALMIAGITFVSAFLYNFIKNKYNEYKQRQIKITDHQFFENLETLKIQITELEIVENREFLREMCLCYINIMHSEIIKIVDSLNNSKMGSTKFENEIKRNVLNIKKIYLNEIKNLGIPEVIIEITENNFDTTKTLFFNYINSISQNNEIYRTKIHKLCALLDVLFIIMNDKIWHIINLQDKFNGELKGITYKGIPLHRDDYDKFKTIVYET